MGVWLLPLMLISSSAVAQDARAPLLAGFDSEIADEAAIPDVAAEFGDSFGLAASDPTEVVTPNEVVEHLGYGRASYYGRRFHGRTTASGESFDMHAMTAAHRTLPFGSLVRVTNRQNGRSVVVRINDRGPFHGNRVIDVSRAAATELGLIGPGSGEVELELLAG